MTQNVDANAGKTSTTSVLGNPRLGEVEKEVKKLKADIESFVGLKNTVDDLKNTITDIRVLISEAQNPSNLLQLITREDDLNSVIQTKPLIEKRQLVNKSAKKSTETTRTAQVESTGIPEPANAGSPTGFAVESIVETKGPSHMEKAVTCETDKIAGIIEFSRGTTPEVMLKDKTQAHPLEKVPHADLNKDASIVHWIYAMLDLGFDFKSIQKICDFCEFTGFMPKGYGIQVSNLVGAIIKARSHNLSPEEVILSIHAAANAVGVKKDSDDLEGLIISVLKKSKSNKCSKCGRPRS